jgi:hypothetical protein
MVETKKRKSTIAVKKVKELCNEFSFTAGIPKGLLAEGSKIK